MSRTGGQTVIDQRGRHLLIALIAILTVTLLINAIPLYDPYLRVIQSIVLFVFHGIAWRVVAWTQSSEVQP